MTVVLVAPFITSLAFFLSLLLLGANAPAFYQLRIFDQTLFR